MDYTSIIMIVALIAIFYFMMLRPEKKKKQKLQELRDNLKVGDTVTTIGGIIGDVVSVSDEYLVLETSHDRVRVQFAKWAISTAGKATEEPAK